VNVPLRTVFANPVTYYFAKCEEGLVGFRVAVQYLSYGFSCMEQNVDGENIDKFSELVSIFPSKFSVLLLEVYQ